MGRNGRYETHVKPFLEDIKKWYEFETEKQISSQLGITQTSFERFKKQHPELREALAAGRQSLITDLKESLKKKAHGFHYTETKKTIRNVDGVKTTLIEEFDRYSPPDTGAIHILLKNLDDDWRNDDKQTMALKREELDMKKQQQQPEDDGAILQTLENIKNGS